MNPKVLIFTDISQIAWSRSAGSYRIATELRKNGYSTLVVEHFLWASITNPQYIYDTIDRFISDETLVVGFSMTLMQKKFFNPAVNFAKKIDPEINKDLLLEMDHNIYAIPLQNYYLQHIKERILRKNPKVKIVLGGASKNFINIDNTIFDTYVLGFADTSFITYIKYLDGKNPFFQFKKIENGKVVIDNDINAIGFSVNDACIEWQDEDIMFENERVPIEISRGCIFKCKFCGYALNGKNKNDYIKDTYILKNEFLRNYEKYGITNYWFTDDTYNDNIVKIQGIHNVIKSLPFALKFRAYLRLDLLSRHRETIDLLTDSGLDYAMFGIESLNYENAKLVGKGIQPTKVFSTLEYLWKEKGWSDKVFVMAMIILGLPHDRLDNISWIDDMKKDNFYVDNISFNPLYISTGSSDFSKSQFDREYEKYGYYFKDSVWEWKNKKTGLTYTQCNDIVNQFRLKNPKNITGSLQENYKVLSKKEMYDIVKGIYDISNINQRWKIQEYLYRERINVMEVYFKRLLSL